MESVTKRQKSYGNGPAGSGQHAFENGFRPLNGLVSPLLTDFYQITMCYSYWKQGIQDDIAVFELFFRKNPFGGEYTVFAGLEEVLRHVSSFRLDESQLAYLKEQLPRAEPEFFTYLKSLDCSKVTIRAVEEGAVVFPKTPLIQLEGPIGVVQLLETTLLLLVNYASLVATNAARHRRAAGKDKILVEFGARRAQGPDGAISAARYTYIGGCDGTSNVAGGLLLSLPISGTHAHSFVSSFSDMTDVKNRTVVGSDGQQHDLVVEVGRALNELSYHNTNKGELAAFTAYAVSFPQNFLALVDTYDTLNSGVPNFLAVALALHRIGYRAKGIRLDSGDLSYLSKQARLAFVRAGLQLNIEYLASLVIVASNDINEHTLLQLAQEGHEIDIFGIGTHLVTCQKQPALGCVYKLVEFRGKPRIKLSQQMDKVTIPGKKELYRLYSGDGCPVVDLLMRGEEGVIPQPGVKVLCRHPFEEKKRANVIPSKVKPMLQTWWQDNKLQLQLPSLKEVRDRCQHQIHNLRSDHVRPLNPTPMKVSVTGALYDFLHEMWFDNAPIVEIN